MSRSLVRGLLLLSLVSTPLLAQPIPHNQDRPPGPPLSPEEALEKFRLPEGFRLELVASEPDILNPIKMCFDSRGRIWLVESLEYPRRSAGEGRDRVKILEDTDGDGKADRFRIFAEGLNIPCGIALGHGGVFVTNSPDVLFLEDTDGDDRADRRTVVLTGFGRHDTHELPNTLTWGPDGWLYGLNGVFNPARIVHKGKEHRFTCALWRYHPRSDDFEVFAEGTSNPWGLGFDREGAAFVEACVIDHLFHLTETGYYHRQAGAYPPFTWKIESIVEHRNYKAAYCGLDFYDADAYPEEYRGRVYYGNIHGSCINSDTLRREGSTYFAGPASILLKTDDVWFMPVDIRLGPDGYFYVLDWYDRYHCYQDARRDPEGIDRGKGRLWRIVYGESNYRRGFDLARETSAELVERLGHPNRWWRDKARRILSERRDDKAARRLQEIVLDETGGTPRYQRLQAFWTLLGREDPGTEPRSIGRDFHLAVLALPDAGLRAWGVRAAGNLRRVHAAVTERVAELAGDPAPDVRLQVAIASRKLFREQALPVLLEVLARSGNDPLIPRIVWRNLEPLLETQGDELVSWLRGRDISALPGVEALLGRMVDRLLACEEKDPAALASMVALLLSKPDAHREATAQCLSVLSRALQNGELEASTLELLRPRLTEAIGPITRRGMDDPLYMPSVTIAASWGEPAALSACRAILEDPEAPLEPRRIALRALLITRDTAVLEFASKALAAPETVSEEFLIEILSALGKLESRDVARMVLDHVDRLPAGVAPQAIDLLCQRPAWAHALLDAVAEAQIDPSRLNVTQVRRLLALRDEKIARRVAETWGTIRAERNPEREKVIARMKSVLAKARGNPWKGKAVFEKTCAQCHIIFGEGQEVGPDITVNGRETLDLLLSNLLDPNLVIGKDYYARNVLTRDGRALTGLLIEDSPQRVVLRVAGGKEEVVPRRDVLDLSVSEVSLMPEDLENTISEDEFRDLIAFLRYDEPPPAPTPTTTAEGVKDDAPIEITQSYGEVTVSARAAGETGPFELLRYRHSNDRRSYIHPLRAPAGGPVLTAVAPSERPWNYGVFTAHASVNDADFWREKGWIRSRGLSSVRHDGRRAVIEARNDWLTERRGGERILVEEQTVVVHAPDRSDRYAVDLVWKLTANVDLELARGDHGGLAFRAAEHDDRRVTRPSEGRRAPWQALSGRFGNGKEACAAGVAIFDHPENPGFPVVWRVGSEGLLNAAITAREPLHIDKDESVTFRYRILVHEGHADGPMLDAEYRRWAPEGSRKLSELEASGRPRRREDSGAVENRSQ